MQGTTLEVKGDKASDKLTLVPDGATTLALDVGSDGTIDFSFDRSTFDKVHVNAGDGDDEINVIGNVADEAFTFEGGAGDDRLIGGNGADTLDGGSGNDFVDGNQGNDTALLGSGNDTFQWDPGDGSDTVEGQSGADALQFNGSNIGEEMNVSPNGTRVRFTRNIANIVMDLGTLERINVRALGGADNVTVDDLAGTGLQLVDVDESGFDGNGDAVKDNVIVNGTNGADKVSATSPTPGSALISGLATKVQVDKAEFTQDVVTVNGLFGDDTITAGIGVTGPAAIVANGGDGTDTASYLGTDGDDDGIFIASVGTGIARVGTATDTGIDVSAGTEETLVQGLGGNDRVAGQNGVSTASHFTIDGGNGDDTLGGGDGDDLLLGGSGNDLVDGNRGVDTARMGSGNDTFQWDPGDGNDTVDGESGSDALQFNGSNAGEDMTVSADGARVRFTRNIANIVMDLGTLERVNVRALGARRQRDGQRPGRHAGQARRRRRERLRRQWRCRQGQRDRQRHREGGQVHRLLTRDGDDAGRRPGGQGPGRKGRVLAGPRDRQRPRRQRHDHLRRHRHRPGGDRRQRRRRHGHGSLLGLAPTTTRCSSPRSARASPASAPRPPAGSTSPPAPRRR